MKKNTQKKTAAYLKALVLLKGRFFWNDRLVNGRSIKINYGAFHYSDPKGFEQLEKDLTALADKVVHVAAGVRFHFKF